MYYIQRLLSGIARYSEEEFEGYDFQIENIPEGVGILMVSPDGELYYDGISEPAENVTDHEILMTLLGVTE